MTPTKAQLEKMVQQMSQAEYEEILRRIKEREALFYGGVLAFIAAFL